MQCARVWLVLVLIVAIEAAPRASADDEFLAGMSTIVTREARKQIKGKQVPFTMGPIQGQLQAAQPEQYLHVHVTSFDLAGDVLGVTVTATGRFQVDCKVDGETDVSAVFDVKCAVIAEVKFTKEGDKFFVEPKIKDMDLSLTVLEVSRSELQGGEELLSGLAVAAFKKNKHQVISEVNKRLGKRPF